MLSFFKTYSPLWSECRQQIHADHFYKENSKSIGGHFLNDTGDKGQNTQWVHAEHIENTDNMCLQYAQWSNVEHI